jgi:TnpA family transposase
MFEDITEAKIAKANKILEDGKVVIEKISDSEEKSDLDIQVNLIGKHGRKSQSHEIAKRVRPRLKLIVDRYNARMKIKGDLNVDEENEAYQAIREIVLNKYPQLLNFLDDVTITKKGKLDTWTMGFRYVLQIGIAF